MNFLTPFLTLVTTAGLATSLAAAPWLNPSALDTPLDNGPLRNPRLGINAATPGNAKRLASLGIGRVRFENLKWPMTNAGPGKFAYDGSVAPWHVKHDELMAEYHAAGLQILPFLFQTADHASTAPEGTKANRLSSYPPKDDSAFAQFVWQSVARYGGSEHPKATLLTTDQKSGLNLIPAFEIWNEPNLNAPEWGPWVAELPRYFDLFRSAADAARKADPKTKVSHAGFAGIDLDTVHQLASHRYADGKSPIDFTDIINVHYYSGKVPPERASVDPNVERGAVAGDGARTFEDDLRRLRDWRNQYAPGKPIWITETGYDTAGPHGISEAQHTARLPRVVMLCLAAGCESVFVYRESGSVPSQHAASGLLRDDGSAKPAWNSYATMARMLDGAGDAHAIGHGDNRRVFVWAKGESANPVVTAWSIEGEDKFPHELGVCTLTDAFGKTHKLTATADIALGEYPVYLSGFADPKALNALRTTAIDTEKKRQTARTEQAKLPHYAFDFGSETRVRVVDSGTIQRAQAVLAKHTYDAGRGYGFTPKAALRDDDRRWISDFAERDSTRVDGDMDFQIDIEPGRYELQVSAGTLSPTPIELTLDDGTGMNRGKITLSKETSTGTANLRITTKKLLIRSDGYLDLRWLELRAQPE